MMNTTLLRILSCALLWQPFNVLADSCTPFTWKSLFGKTDPVFETYINWWVKEWETIIETMPLHDGMIVNIAFSNWGKALSEKDEARTVAIVKALQERTHREHVRVFIKLSFGGSTYPMPDLDTDQDAENLATVLMEQLEYFKRTYGITFDGIDLDIESSNNSSPRVSHFITSLKSALDIWGECKLLTLTIIGQYWLGFYRDLAMDQNVQTHVDAIQFMEYGGLRLHAPNLEKQIEYDILTYVTPKNEPGPIPKQKGWGIPRDKVRIGLKPGYDHGQYLSPDDAYQLAEFARKEGFSGVMIWSTFRDAGAEDGTTHPPYTYTTAILQGLYPENETKKYNRP